jgi:hypothetical protein
VRAESQAGVRGDPLRDPGHAALEEGAAPRRAGVLPRERRGQRPAGVAIPEEQRRSLRGDAEHSTARRRPGRRLGEDRPRRVQKLGRVMLDAAGARSPRAEAAPRHAPGAAALVEQERLGARGADVESDPDGRPPREVR